MRHSLKHLTPFCGTIILAAAALAGVASGQTNLTTIQDTLFKADGSRFSGTLNIQWNTFDAVNIGTIVQQSKSVTVVNGNLQVQLAPNAAAPAPANVYTVHYQSDGNQQFTETWSVPVSAQALAVAVVRTGMLSSGSQSTGNQTPIVESAVVGLSADLAIRPIKGPGFGTGSVAVINEDGQIETAVGNLGDCVYVDGTSGPCGGQASAFFDAETPGGLVDGVNTTFTLANAPSGSSLMLFRNGLYMMSGSDYTLTGSSLTFLNGAGPQPGDTLVASYRIDPSAGNIGAIQSPGSQTRGSAAAQVLCSANGTATGVTVWSSLGACDIPAAALKPGDRIEVRFNFVHTGTASGFSVQVNWGTTTVIARQGGAQDTAFAGQVDSAINTSGAQITTQSWGSVLSFLPCILSSPVQQGVRVDLRGALAAAGSDSLSLANFTVLRYPGV